MKKIKIVGNILTLLALLFVLKKLLSTEMDFSVLRHSRNLIVLGIVFALYSFCVYILAVPWKRLLDLFEVKYIQFYAFSNIYLKANIMKYIPGNVFQYIGRNELANRFGYKYSSINFASFLEIALIVFVSTAMSLCINGQSTYELFVSYGIIWLALVATMIVIIVVLMLYHWSDKFKKYGRIIKQRVINTRAIKNIVVCILFYGANLLTQGMLFCAVLLIYEAPNSIYLCSADIIGAFITSWLVGYLTPGSPGGIGVREAVMVSMLNYSVITADSILMALVITRAITIFGDLFAFLVSSLFSKWMRRQS